MSANDAKRNFGHLLDTARREPVTVQKHGRPVTVMMSVEDYEDYRKIQRENLKAELQIGIGQLDRGEATPFDAAGLGDLMESIKTEGRKEFEKSVAD
jgi:prevent-host-death family protein